VLIGLKTIIVEDNFAVAHSLSILLQSLRCDVVGMAGNLDDAIDLADSAEYDVAILDISLRDQVVTDVARRVEAKGKRIVYLTGFAGTDLLPQELRAHPCLSKPVRMEALVEAILGKAES
jgi:two-component SAPR family response regulator